MKDVIGTIFSFLSVAFDKIPMLSKFKGYRSVLGLVGLAVVMVLQQLGVGSEELLGYLNIGFLAFTGLSLNAKANE